MTFSSSSQKKTQHAGIEVPQDERLRRVLAPLDLSGVGLEIGPSHNPLLPKRSGARIEIVDHASREELVAKYRGLALDEAQIDRIEEVDHVSSGGSLVEAIGRTAAYDYIICSNVVEHMVDLIGFLQDIDALLKPNGRLSMTVPDQRFSFDLMRPISSIGDAVDSNLNSSPFHTPGTLLESSAFYCRRSGLDAWTPGYTGPLQLHWSGPLIRPMIEQWLNQTEYNDTHRWVFTPSSFSLLVQDLRDLGYHSLAELTSESPMGHEFFVTLGHFDTPPPHLDRLALMQQIRREIALAGAVDGLGPTPAELDQAMAAGLGQPESPRSTVGHEDPLTSARREADTFRALAAERGQALAAAQRDLDGVLSSRSWQITRPIRRISSVLRRR